MQNEGGTFYQTGANTLASAVYNIPVDFTDIDTLYFHNYGAYTASNTITYTLGLVDEKTSNSFLVKTTKSQYSAGNNQQTIDLTLDVSEIVGEHYIKFTYICPNWVRLAGEIRCWSE